MFANIELFPRLRPPPPPRWKVRLRLPPPTRFLLREPRCLRAMLFPKMRISEEYLKVQIFITFIHLQRKYKNDTSVRI